MQKTSNALGGETVVTAEQLNKRFGRYSMVVGFLLILLGSVGMVLPELMSLETSIFIASLFLVGGVFWLSHSFKYSRKDWADWLKPVLLLVTGGFMLFYPLSGIAAVGLLLAVYLLLDAFGSFSFASSLRPAPGWGWMMFNGVLSLLLAMLFLIGWPATSMFLVGLYVAISLFFDGVVLVYIGWTQRHAAV
ncbi:HdeD family acid-resistance protein [Thiolapillus brandeum]|uniref:HdeD family acid-resistance protein n=1 Tax=Thiolapillus brandeum TaxID=1076588 RepID=A0A7U6GJD0_9GAMM|nr:DUF308 domain-containing protein [Thiolapillus brandeum]BAO44689.1 conserved hypothetical protein [Thiolapillus brandeum]